MTVKYSSQGMNMYFLGYCSNLLTCVPDYALPLLQNNFVTVKSDHVSPLSNQPNEIQTNKFPKFSHIIQGKSQCPYCEL